MSCCRKQNRVLIMINDKSSNCTGCTACASICSHHAIQMNVDSEGFLYPKVDLSKCVNCGLCDLVCPLNHDLNKQSVNPKIYAALNKDKETYIHSSSGGIFMLLCDYVIANGGVVCGAVYDKNFKVCHQFRNTLEGCRDFQTSKYVQSNIEGIFKEIKIYLKEDKFVLFSGTPCQVAALKLFLRKKYNNLLTCDIICHGVPSPLIFEEYKHFVAGQRGIKSINMKFKNSKISGTTLQFEFLDGSSDNNSLKTNIWFNLYFGHLISRPSCHVCKFTSFNREGDITIGDFWHYNQKHPEFHPGKTISIVIVSSSKGEEVFSHISEKLDYQKSFKDEAVQPQLMHPSSKSCLRDDFWHDYHEKGFVKILAKYANYTISERLKEKIKKML